jgi:hypothetical protein
MIHATVSGSFHRHMTAIYDAVGSLRAAGVTVLSPSNPTVVDHIGEFLFVASDRLRSVKLVQDRHLEAIRNSDFLWVVCPDGYTGASTSGEVMAAAVLGVPVFSSSPALDITIGEYVERVGSIGEAIARVAPRMETTSPHVLIDPRHSIATTIGALEALEPTLLGKIGDGRLDAERRLARVKVQLASTFGLSSK